MEANETARKKLGEIFARARVQAGFSQTKAAQAIGLGRTTLSNYELGISEPGLIDGLRLCKLLGLDPAGILDLTELQLDLPLGKEPRLHGNRYSSSAK